MRKLCYIFCLIAANAFGYTECDDAFLWKVPCAITVQQGVPLLGTWDFTNATVLGVGGGSTCITCSGIDGQVAIWNASASRFIAGDPIVSGPDAPGSAPTKNPVQIGLYDGTNIQRVLGSTLGRLSVDVNSMPTTTVSGTVTANQGTSPWVTSDNHGVTTPLFVELSNGAGAYNAASSSQLPAALDGSGFLKTHEQGTATISGTVTANAGTNLNTSALALDTSINGILLSQASTTSGQKGAMSLGAVTTSAPTYTTAQTDPLSLNTAGGLRVDGSGVTQPVSGTVTANAGTNLNTSALALDSSVNGILLAQAGTTTGQKGPIVQAAVTTSAPTYTTAQTDPLSLTTAGALRVDGSAVTQPVSGTVTANAGTGVFGINVSQVAATNVATAGLSSGVQKVGIVGNANAIFDGATAAAVPANVLYEGARVATANPTNGSNGNLVGLEADKAGRLVVTHGNVRELIGVQQTAVASTSETTIITAGAAGVFNDLSELIITTAGAAAATITIKDATAGTTRIVLNYPNAALAPAAPMILSFNPPIPQAAAASNWTVTNSVATSTNITAVFVKNL